MKILATAKRIPGGLTVVKVGIGIAAEDASVPDAHLTIARKPETRRVPTRRDAKF